jgi:hypothetical protein
VFEPHGEPPAAPQTKSIGMLIVWLEIRDALLFIGLLK